MSHEFGRGRDYGHGRGGGSNRGFRGRGGARGGFRGGPGGQIRNSAPMPSVLIDRRFAMQPLPERSLDNQNSGSSTSAIASMNYPPTRTRYNDQPKEFPQDRRFFCDRCFRGYETAHYYQLHLQNHIKCLADGCTFEGLPRVVAKHLLTFHAYNTGNGTVSKAAIDKWLNARKRNFPSHDVVECKERSKQSKMERGEVLENRNAFGKFSITSLDKEKREAESAFIEDADFDPSVSQLQEASKRESSRQRFVGTGELIEKLLAEDIRHERNVLLQCIRYIVNHGPEFGIMNTVRETGTVIHSDSKKEPNETKNI